MTGGSPVTRDHNIMISGVMIKELVRHPDERGFFEEMIRKTDEFFAEGFGQVSHSFMHQGVVKAWHIHKTQIDWWYVVQGVIKAALVDMREGSPTYKQQMEIVLGKPEEPNKIIKIPPGVAHGLKVLVGPADLVYVTSGIYSKEEEGRIPYDDPGIGYDWVQGMPITNKNIT
jgi:dTDP-4-dehydrorhamnose 3,5-epimerase